MPNKVKCEVCGYVTSQPCTKNVQQAIDCPARKTLQIQNKKK
jgi:hypothetical protein